MKKYMSTLIIIGVIGVITFFSGYAYILQRRIDHELSPKIYSTLFLPYSIAIREGRLEDAYRDFTTDKYKLKHSYEEFKKVQLENKEYYGKLDSMNLTTGIFVYLKDLDRQWVYRGTVNYFTSSKDTKFSADVVEENGKFKLSRTYPSQMTIRASAPLIF